MNPSRSRLRKPDEHQQKLQVNGPIDDVNPASYLRQRTEVAVSRHAQSTFEFDRFRVDPNQRVLFRDGRPLSLPPKVFQTLLLLVESPGKVVPKEDFFARVWNDSVVEESNLT